MAAHERCLAACLLDFLDGVAACACSASARASATRVPTISFTVDGADAADIVRAVDAARIGIKHGDFYARRLVDRLGLGARGGVIRASLVHYNTMTEMRAPLRRARAYPDSGASRLTLKRLSPSSQRCSTTSPAARASRSISANEYL